MPTLEFFDDPRAFLDVAADLLAADPVLTTVVATVTQRAADDGLPPTTGPRWWVVVRDGDLVVGAGMRTAPVAPHWVYVLPMPDDAALLLARTLHARGEEVAAVNGALPAARVLADETARLTSRATDVYEHTRLHELGTLRPPPPVPGRLRPAEPDDVPLALEWWEAFERDAGEQAGRARGHGPLEPQDAAGMLRRVEQRRMWFWVDADGRTVHLTAANAPAFGVVRVGPVYTPAGERGRGYASAAVAEVSRLELERGHRVCLFTDQANPISNRIYEALGYRPVADMVNLVVR